MPGSDPIIYDLAIEIRFDSPRESLGAFVPKFVRKIKRSVVTKSGFTFVNPRITGDGIEFNATTQCWAIANDENLGIQWRFGWYRNSERDSE